MSNSQKYTPNTSATSHIPVRQNDFNHQAHDALNDGQLRTNFRRAMDGLIAKRTAQFPDSDDLEARRLHAEAIRQRCLNKLPQLLEQLESNLKANGIKVHWAETAEQACEIIYGISECHQAKSMIKGKSMVSEEIELNHFMAERGIDCLESDMGEYIVQLAEEKPSHIIMPAIHKNAVEVAKLFEDKIPDHSYTEDIDELIQTGRRELRKAFFNADIGLSGVNFMVAETGTLCLVENEGNGRMSTHVPPVHVAVTGIEKVVEFLSDVPPLYHLLTRSATGQPITTYFNMISGPRGENEKDGPKEVHLVLLDNGRSQAYADAQMRKTLQCIRCGACMNHCPVYSRIGGHAYKTVYPGPIGKIISPHMMGLEQTKDLPSASTLCGACGDVCPVKIPIPSLLQRLRIELKRVVSSNDPQQVNMKGAGAGYNAIEARVWKIFSWIYSSRYRYKMLSWMASRFGKLLPNIGPVAVWSKVRSKPVPANKTLHQLMEQRSRQASGQSNGSDK
ncbi:LutB/LldF family L-lactate oxidation iron-sulfur protein [Pelagibaculum spongiae]|uniref:Iron-sulfur cluster-binding protein n=1 Tax=Pelagibaculum spongiae TaxID=2080658 RepID=A0A2V1H1C0_9GAMM|nr:LutB/LldF family L-lactate oxidation iron-sulfur protein [Pelagibaculum spongiae]PVZ68370.1 iron-sulfur cluster-binding protein [Pelagibaculum spongiae]